ncbi:hypothetical protein HY745_13195 [Candidatus Desantisbacteria bacterium]|nr:hypothetical protein [Candidatus Desantisbacteria bacterium]
MKENRFNLFLLLVLIITLIGMTALACGGGSKKRENQTQDTMPSQATADLDGAYNLLNATQIMPPFMKNGNLDSFDSGAAASLLPSPDKLSSDTTAAGEPKTESYEEAITKINNAINLVNAARKAEYTAGYGQGAYLHFIVGYIFTVNAASRLVHSPLGKEVIHYSNGIYTISLGDKNHDGKTNLGDLSGGKGYVEAVKSCQAIIDALYLLTGRRYEIHAEGPKGTDWDSTNLGVSSRLLSLFPNINDPAHNIPGKKTNNALYHYIRSIEFGEKALTGIEKGVQKVQGYINKFDTSLYNQASAFGFVRSDND